MKKKVDGKRRGVALLFTVGILGLLALIGITFVLNMLLTRKEANNYLNSVKARYSAEAGIARAIAELRAEAQANFTDTLTEAWASGYNATMPDNTYNVTVVDEGRKVNINNAPIQLLDNLPGITPALAADILDYRDDQYFSTAEELKCVTGITPAIYNNIANYITVSSYLDTHLSRSPINVNTADSAVITMVLSNISDGAGLITDAKLTNSVNAIVASRPFSNWQAFDACIDALGFPVQASDKAVIKNNCNPNRTKPSTYTTEFCFNSGGVYSLQSTGVVNNAGIPMATKQVQTTAKIFDMWNQTTRDEFKQVWLNDVLEEVDLGDGDIVWVTWWDSCPVRSDQSWSTALYDTISDSLKLGFWDDFKEEVHNWTADHLNDWTTWYFGSGSVYVSGGWLITGGGWTQENLAYQDPYSWPPPRTINCNRWNIRDIACTISADVWKLYIPMEGTLLYRGVKNSNSDATAWMKRDLIGGSGNYIASVQTGAGVDTSVTTVPPTPKRLTLRLTSGTTVAAVYLSSGQIGGTLMISNSDKCIQGEEVRQYQGALANVRVIPGKRGANIWNGRYVSTPNNLDSQVRLGNIAATVTIPPTASAASEAATVAFCPDGNVDMNEDGTLEAGLNPGDLTNALRYVVYLSSNNALLFETPAVEDITMTYMKSTVVLYTR